MTRTAIVLFVLISVFSTAGHAARSNVVVQPNLETAQCAGAKLQLPKGTRILRATSKSLRFRLPSTHFVARHHGGFGLGVKLTCTCTEGSGCNPTAAGGSVGCTLTSSCSKCNGTKTGFIMEDTGIVFESASKKASAAPFDGDMMELPWLSDELDAFVENLYGNNEIPSPMQLDDGSFVAPQGHQWVALRVYGHQASILVPEARISGGMMVLNAVSCSCSSGSGGCTKKSDWRGVTWCEAGSCTSCTMDTGASFTDVTETIESAFE